MNSLTFSIFADCCRSLNYIVKLFTYFWLLNFIRIVEKVELTLFINNKSHNFDGNNFRFTDIVFYKWRRHQFLLVFQQSSKDTVHSGDDYVYHKNTCIVHQHIDTVHIIWMGRLDFKHIWKLGIILHLLHLNVCCNPLKLQRPHHC